MSLTNKLFFYTLGVLAWTLAPATGEVTQGVPQNRVPQGGGVIYPAWTAQYWANAEMKGEPAISRSEVRVRSDWEDWRPILGVKAESLENFPRENFSAKYSAKLIPRFDEEYTFNLLSDEQARLRIRTEGSADWRTLIDSWAPHKRQTDKAKLNLKPGTTYEIEIDFVNLKGDAVCSLSWESPSTPEEVVDYVSGTTTKDYFPYMLADLTSMTGNRPAGVFPASGANAQGGNVDENGWHTEDFKFVILQGYPHYGGRGLIRFEGQADVKISSATFEVDGKSYPTLPKGIGYNPATNETRAFVDFKSNPDGMLSSQIFFTNTQRDPNGPSNTGVTDLDIMLPTEAGGKTPHEPGEMISQPIREAFKTAYAIRYQTSGLNDIVKWSERTLPTYSRYNAQIWRNEPCYEKIILAANESGRDLHLCFSGSCDEDYMKNLALLFKYGSDGKNVYTKPTPNPVWPPLNANLRLYLEHGNEMGWSAIQPKQWSQDYEKLRKEKAHPYEILNFDGLADTTSFEGLMRYHAYRTLRMSENMRNVWGDEAMGETIRTCLFGQYDRNFQNTLMQFIEDYYNNPKYVKNPHPPSYFIWGTGPAVYYGTTNIFAVGDKQILPNGSFEEAEVPKGTALLAPKVTGWTFEGGAGVVDNQFNRHSAFVEIKLGQPLRVEPDSVVGFQFTVGDKDLYAYDIGRIVHVGDSAESTAMIYDASGKAVNAMRLPKIVLKGKKPGEMVYSPLEHTGWITPDSSRVGVWHLKAGSSYIAVTQAPQNGDIPGPGTTLDAGPGISIDGSVLVKNAKLSNDMHNGAFDKVGGPGTGFPLVNFHYSFALEPQPGMSIAPSDPNVDPTWQNGGKDKSWIPPLHRSGTKSAFLAGKGKMSTKFNISKASEYAYIFTGNSGWLGKGAADRVGNNPLTITIDDKVVWEKEAIGSGRKPRGGVFMWGTRYVRLEPGEHTLTIESLSDDPLATAYIYAGHLGDMLDYAGGPNADNFLKGTGEATGQTEAAFERNTKITTAMSQLWGTVPYVYEGGVNAGGDWGGEKLYYANQFKWDHPLSKVADNNWAKMWHDWGGANAMYYYEGFPPKYFFRAGDFMTWQAATERASKWLLEPIGQTAAPTTFTNATPHFQGKRASTWTGWAHPWISEAMYKKTVTPTLDQEGMWKGFVFRAPKTGDYTITATTKEGGELELNLNDGQAIAKGASGQPASLTVHLNQGVHSAKVKNVSGSFEFISLDIK